MSNVNWKTNTALFLTGQALSLIGSMLVQYAIMWHVVLDSNSGSMMTMYVFAGILPNFFISPFGGVWADRYNRKYLINGADAVIALASLAAGICYSAGAGGVWILLTMAAVRALGQGVQTPAVNSFIPQIVPEEHLSRVNGINGSIQSLAFLVSPAASAALLSFLPFQYVFYIDVITAAIGIAIVFFLVKAPKVLQAPAKEDPRNESEDDIVASGDDIIASGDDKGFAVYFHDLKEGLRYTVRHGWLWRLIAIEIVFFLFAGPPSILTPLQVSRKFGTEMWRLSAIEMTFSIGMMVSGIVVGWWGGFKNKVYSMSLACALFGALTILLGVVNIFPVYIAVMTLTGMTMPLFNVPSMVLLQTRVENAYMGRVFGVFSMVSSVIMPAGMLVFGPLADVFSIDTLLVSGGAVIVLSGIPYVASKVMREAGKPPETPPASDPTPPVF